MKRDEIVDKARVVHGLIEDVLAIETVLTTRSTIVVRGTPRLPADDFRAVIDARFRAAGLTVEVETLAPPGSPAETAIVSVPLTERAGHAIPLVNIALFAATVMTTVLFGGPSFAAWFLAILLFHEFGHFIFARLRRMDVSWPYFIPAPNILGTFGAFIQLRSPIRDRRGLFDMAVAGPLAGFVVSVVALAVGLAGSDVAPSDAAGDGLLLGESLLFRAVAAVVLPGVTDEQTIILHPVAFAGWAGLLVTMFNMLPMGQLDGGHIAYALWRRAQRPIALATIAGLLIAAFWWPWWIVWAGIGFFLRPHHPPTIVDELPVGRSRFVLGCISFVVFIICFTPIPFSFPGS
ncbi:MAG TPA: site-2 protease family protein [candidate division Zixibacteria bacterium]|jgi:hypothetical protein